MADEPKIVPAQQIGRWEQIDMTLGDNSVVAIKQFNGRQGDNRRLAHLKLVQDSQNGPVPYILNGMHPYIELRDFEGTFKEFGEDYNITDAAQGKVDITVPGQVYQAIGPIQNGFLKLMDNNSTVISSVAITFTVQQDATNISETDSEMYIQRVENVKNAALDKFDGINKLVLACQSTLAALINQVGDIAKISGDNHFIGNNTFANDVVIHGKSFDGMDAAISAIQNSLNNGFTDTGWVPMAIDTSLFSGSLSIRKIVFMKPLITFFVVIGQVRNLKTMDPFTRYRICSLPQGITAPSYSYMPVELGGGSSGSAGFDDDGNFFVYVSSENTGDFIQFGSPKFY